MAKIQIIFGSVMGTALGFAKTAESILTGFGHEVTFHERFRKSMFDPEAVLLVCTSNTGMGDLPENIVPFYLFLRSDTPPIHGMKYGLITLGDSSYPNFAEAGNVIDEALADLGAERIDDIFIMDALLVDDHEEEASEWISQWQQKIS